MRKIFLCLFLLSSVAFSQNGSIRTITASITTSSVLVLSANKRRNGISIYNNSANSVYLTFGPTSSSASCSRILATFANFDMLGPAIYRGEISAIRNAGSGTLIISEFLDTVNH